MELEQNLDRTYFIMFYNDPFKVLFQSRPIPVE